MNKVSAKNVQSQTATLFDYLRVAEMGAAGVDAAEAEGTYGTLLLRALTVVVDVAAANKFYAETYADLVSNVFLEYRCHMTDILQSKYSDYRESFHRISNAEVDPEKDYDGFCAFQKQNECRRAATLFFMFLERLPAIRNAVDETGEALLPHGSVATLEVLVDLLKDTMELPNKLPSVEEFTEHISLLWNQSAASSFISAETRAIMKTVASYKANMKPSLSSRVIFSFQNMILQSS
jgi:hypothetical protein